MFKVEAKNKKEKKLVVFLKGVEIQGILLIFAHIFLAKKSIVFLDLFINLYQLFNFTFKDTFNLSWFIPIHTNFMKELFPAGHNGLKSWKIVQFKEVAKFVSNANKKFFS